LNSQYKDVTSWLRPEHDRALTVRTLQRSTLAMVVVRYGDAVPAESDHAVVPDDAQTFGWNLRGAAGVECVSRNPKVKSAVNEGETMFCALPELDFLRLTAPCIAQHFVLTRTFLDALSEDLDAPPISHIGRPDTAVDDPMLAALGSRVLSYMCAPEDLDLLAADHIMKSLAIYVCGRYGGLVMKRPLAGGLTRWQIRLSQEMIDASLATGIPLKTLAEACGLRTSQFAHAFKRSTGIAPHRWLVNRRLERARTLLRAPTLPLADIALVCGFADQSHFTRTFRRHHGVVPSVWRAAA
jgi:AraC family transcriptional regulator